MDKTFVELKFKSMKDEWEAEIDKSEPQENDLETGGGTALLGYV